MNKKYPPHNKLISHLKKKKWFPKKKKYFHLHNSSEKELPLSVTKE